MINPPKSAQAEVSVQNARLDKNDPREIFGWKMYDWANSAFYTTVVGALFSPYLTRLAQNAVGENGVVLDLGFLGAVTAKSLPSLCVSISVGVQVFLLPVLGALGDYSNLKKRLMALFCYIAVTATCLLFFIKDGLYLWGGFAIITFRLLKTRSETKKLPPGKSYLTTGFLELASTFRELRRLPLTLRYLLGYLIYNDGIQTVMFASSAFLEQELFKNGNPTFLLEIFLMVQFVAVPGALLFERLAYLIKTKNAILVSLVLWAGIVIYAYKFLHTVTEAWIMAGLIAIVLGGSQALSRSLFSRMIPRGKEASFFGLYEVSERGTSWMRPLLFSIVIARTGSYRQALLSLIFFFIVGLVILLFTNTDRAVHEAGNLIPEEARGA